MYGSRISTNLASCLQAKYQEDQDRQRDLERSRTQFRLGLPGRGVVEDYQENQRRSALPASYEQMRDFLSQRTTELANPQRGPQARPSAPSTPQQQLVGRPPTPRSQVRTPGETQTDRIKHKVRSPWSEEELKDGLAKAGLEYWPYMWSTLARKVEDRKLLRENPKAMEKDGELLI